MLQFITHTNNNYATPTEGAAQALKGGCRWIQLRMKDAAEAEVEAEGRKLRALCDAYGAKLILDDHVGLVKTVGADGVHLGKRDMPVGEARALLGPGIIIGATANSFEDIERAVAAGADYIGLGPYRFTTTKERLSPTLGLEGYRRIMTRMREAGITVPVVAIGGILVDDVAALIEAGVSGVAVSGAILNAENPIEETKRFIDRL